MGPGAQLGFSRLALSMESHVERAGCRLSLGLSCKEAGRQAMGPWPGKARQEREAQAFACPLVSSLHL